MKRLLLLMVIASVLLSSCSGENKNVEPVISPLVAFSETPDFTPIPTSTETLLPTVIPTQALSPDLNTYECAENVSREECDFVKEGVRLARYYFVNNFGQDVFEGVKFVVINDPNDISYGKGGSAGAHQVSKQGESFIWINVGLQVWTEFSAPEFRYKNLGLIVHEFTHEWQWQLGCNKDSLKGAKQPTSFLIEGYAQYVGLTAAEVDLNDYVFSDGLALSFWQANQWDENQWFGNTDVNVVAVKHLIEQRGLKAYAEFCQAVGEGVPPNDAFQSSYGVSIIDFREDFMNDVLGTLKDCTVATCGAGVDNYSDKYKLGHLLDPNQTVPNLIVHFVDQDGKPVIMTHVSMLKQNVGTTGEYAQPFIVPGTFSQAMQPGRYSFFFCEPGYPVDQNDAYCRYHETDWFDVFQNQVTELTFQIPLPIENSNLLKPNIIVKFFDKDGNPAPNLSLSICSYEDPVKVCSNQFAPDRKTDSAGVYSDFLRSGKYLIRIPASSDFEVPFFYQMMNIDVSEDNLTSIEYHFPTPNLVIKFLDVNGSPIPEHNLVLCKMNNGIGDCITPVYNQERWGITNKKGAFEVFVEPGEYYALTCKIDCPGYPFDYTIPNIIVTSETEVKTVEFQLYK